MKPAPIALALILVWIATPAYAHRLDEYLQATTFNVEAQRIVVQMRLTPGVDVLPKVLAAIGVSSADGVISGAQQVAYAQRVRGDVSLTVDGVAAPLRLMSYTFPKMDDMKQGLGDITLDFEADLPNGGSSRAITFENHHLADISVYLANCLIPRDPAIRVTAQTRNFNQSFYRLDYSQVASAVENTPPPGFWKNPRAWFERTGSWSQFKAFFREGVHHILTGYDHLLFVSALVLAATTLWELVKVVSAFTLAHTITLTLAALDVVHVPGRIVEPLISASIVFVAIQNVFWPSRARGWSRLGAAFFFGLFHGLGFAGGLLEVMRQMQTATMLLAILAFSIGVETGHQMIVIPLFGFLKAARHSQTDVVTRTRFSMAFQRIGSAGISVAGAYYLCLALIGRS